MKKNEITPKWSISTVILKGKQALSLLRTYLSILLHRLKPEELEQYEANIAELEIRRAGQSGTLIDQQSNTLMQQIAVKNLNKQVSNIRRLVKSGIPSSDISKAYGVGKKGSTTVSGSMTSGDLVIAGYNKYKEWSNAAGIVNADIEEVARLQHVLRQTDNTQEESKYIKKSRTMDKNTLQRAVEDEITRISAMGILEFQRKDPSVVRLFADLIPGKSKSTTAVVSEAESNG